jgi:hypothetical protein
VVFYYETSLEICIAIFSAIPHTIGTTEATVYEKWSAGFTWFFMVTTSIYLLGLVGFMLFPYPDPELRMTKYIEKVGGIYKNIDHSKWLNRLVPLYFVLKRVGFAVGCWYVKIELVAIFIGVTMVNLCLIMHTKPYLDHLLYKTELFNEAIALVFFTLLQAFKPELLEADE